MSDIQFPTKPKDDDNIFLGKIERDPARLAAAVAYLEVHNAND